ncbi:MAG: hypothetical protein QOE59_946 [Actinomycetota bacterium]|jgi:hypothetical protein|nr:hypothetical protein [Actinomycetota bacterium]
MALPVPESAAGPREDIIRLLAETPEGLSDGELAAALAERYPGLNAKAANHQCRRLVATGMVERVGTRPVRSRLVTGMEVGTPGPEVAATAPATAAEGHSTQPDQPSEVPEVPLDDGTAPPAGLSPVQEDIVRALGDAPAGLTDNELAAALAEQHPHVDPKAFNYQCRKLSKAGIVERTARSKDTPIRTRLSPASQGHTTHSDQAVDVPDVPLAGGGDADLTPEADPTLAEGHTTHPDQAEHLPDVPLAEGGDEGRDEGGDEGRDEEAADADDAQPGATPTLIRPPSRRPRRRAKTPSDDVARIRRSERDGDDPDEPLLRFLPFASAATARTALRERMAERAALRRVPEPTNEVVLPTRDVLQGWSRTQNVAAAVAGWLTRRGGTIRAAHAVGPAHDLVATLNGDDVHVEVTGWPPDGARSHPTTLAGDWFRAATRAATQRRRAHPRSRVVIALPDTRRYRALVDDDAEVLRRARAEVWFVDPTGAVQFS